MILMSGKRIAPTLLTSQPTFLIFRNLYDWYIIIVMLFLGEMVGVDPASNTIITFKNLVLKVFYLESI